MFGSQEFDRPYRPTSLKSLFPGEIPDADWRHAALVLAEPYRSGGLF